MSADDGTPGYIASVLEHAPPAKAPADPLLRGWWIGKGWYLCARCAGRVLGRGGQLPPPASPVYRDRDEPYGVCLGCEPPPARRNPRPVRDGENKRGWPYGLVREHAELRLARRQGKRAALGGISNRDAVRGIQLQSIARPDDVWIIAKSARGDHEWRGVAYPWQVSRFSVHNGGLAPWGHENAKTLDEAVEIVLRQAGTDGVRRVALANSRRRSANSEESKMESLLAFMKVVELYGAQQIGEKYGAVVYELPSKRAARDFAAELIDLGWGERVTVFESHRQVFVK